MYALPRPLWMLSASRREGKGGKSNRHDASPPAVCTNSDVSRLCQTAASATMTGSANTHGPTGHAQELLDAGAELLPASCTPDSPRPWASRAEHGPIEEEEPLTSQRKRRIFLACACILVRIAFKTMYMMVANTVVNTWMSNGPAWEQAA